jgi:hypothetical protein
LLCRLLNFLMLIRGLDEPNSISFIFLILSPFTNIYLALLERSSDTEFDLTAFRPSSYFKGSSMKSIGASLMDALALRRAIGLGLVINIFSLNCLAWYTRSISLILSLLAMILRFR